MVVGVVRVVAVTSVMLMTPVREEMGAKDARPWKQKHVA